MGQEKNNSDSSFTQRPNMHETTYITDKRYQDINRCKMDIWQRCYRRFTGSPYERLFLCRKMLHNDHEGSDDGPKLINQQKYFDCVSEYENIVKLCIHHLYSQCSKSEAVTLKTIRLTMDSIQDILEKDPTVKVIYLLRDPRAIISSRLGSLMSGVTKFKSKRFDTDEHVQHEAKMLCDKMRSDISKSQVLSKRCLNQIKEVRYEEIVQRPKETFKELYEFLQLDTFEAIDKWFSASTYGHDGGKFDTRRVNSSATAFSWERKITFWRLKTIESVCQDVISYLGLKTKTKMS